jgi:glucose-1-phosphate thymidylyltransferase
MLQILEKEGERLEGTYTNNNSTVIPPCYIADGVEIHNSTVGPNVSIGPNTHIENSTIENSMIQSHCVLNGVKLKNAMLGNHVKYNGDFSVVSLGDYTELK